MFPCLKTRSRTIFIDDDEAFIEVLSEVMPSRLAARFFSHPNGVDADLKNQAQWLLDEQLMLMALDPSREGGAIAKAMDYLMWPDRRNIVGVMISDHAMPAETGIELCHRHRYHGLRRILLTGAADADLAVGAFNSGTIECFIPKQSQRLIAQVTRAIDDQILLSSSDRGTCLETFMPREGRAVLGREDVAKGLSNLLEQHQIVDYVTLGVPLGVLGLKADGSCCWIQVEALDSLPLLQSLARDAGWVIAGVERIVNDRLVPNVDMAAQLSGAQPCLAPAVELAPGIIAGVFSVVSEVAR